MENHQNLRIPVNLLGQSRAKNIGIMAFDAYFPKTYVDQEDLEVHLNASKGKYTIGLGQEKMAFCSDRIDVTAMALTTTQRLLTKTGILPKEIGFLMIGTETPVDKSKSMKTSLMQLFEKENNDIEGLHTTNACYGGTAALFHALSWMDSSAWDGRYAIVVAGDEAVSTGAARPTGGCGCIAMLIGPDAPLTLEPIRMTHMEDAYDFYKPNIKTIFPYVDGHLSNAVYLRHLDLCYLGYCKKQELANSIKISLNNYDAVLFHSPYGKLVQKAYARLRFLDYLRGVSKFPSGVSLENQKHTLKDLENSRENYKLVKELVKSFEKEYIAQAKPGLYISRNIGNFYTGALYGCLISLLLGKPISQLRNNQILMFSYGSGAASSMFALRLTSDQDKLKSLVNSISEVPKFLVNRIKVAPALFEKILDSKEENYEKAPYVPQGSLDELNVGDYYLDYIDDKYRRQYKRKTN